MGKYKKKMCQSVLFQQNLQCELDSCSLQQEIVELKLQIAVCYWNLAHSLRVCDGLIASRYFNASCQEL